MFGVKVERQKMLFIKRIVILDLHETIGRFHWCWSLEWKRKISNSSFMSAACTYCTYVYHYLLFNHKTIWIKPNHGRKTPIHSFILTAPSPSLHGYEPLSSIIQKQIFLNNAWLFSNNAILLRFYYFKK